MPRTFLGPDIEGFERGVFAASEAADIAAFTKLALPPSTEPQDPLDIAAEFFEGIARLGAMTFLGAYLSATHNASVIDPRVRLLVYFSKHSSGPVCSASARRVPKISADKPTYLIAFHSEGVPVLRQRTSEVLEGLRTGQSILPLEPYLTVLGSKMPPDECLKMALLFIFFHEIGHVIPGHLEWDPPVHAPCASLSTEGRLLRRALEIHADTFSASFIGKFLAMHADSASYKADPNRQERWLAIGLIAAYVVFTTLAELGEESSACYHSPYVRLLNASGWLGRGIGLGYNAGKLAIVAMSDRLFGTDVAERARAMGVGGGAGSDAAADSAEFDSITMPLIKQLQRDGRFGGWVGPKGLLDA